MSIVASYFVTGANVWKLIKIVVPKVMAQWKYLAFCMTYKIEEVNAFRKDSQDVKECCEKLFENWLTTGHNPVPKTYKTLLNHIKEVDTLTAVSVEIEKELLEGQE